LKAPGFNPCACEAKIRLEAFATVKWFTLYRYTVVLSGKVVGFHTFFCKLPFLSERKFAVDMVGLYKLNPVDL
jgi:hypothetical protein